MKLLLVTLIVSFHLFSQSLYCNGQAKIISGENFYPNGIGVELDGNYIYPNKQLIHKDGDVFYPNGQIVSIGEDQFYPNGQIIKQYGEFYFPDGQLVYTRGTNVFGVNYNYDGFDMRARLNLETEKLQGIKITTTGSDEVEISYEIDLFSGDVEIQPVNIDAICGN